jgi:transcriptional regulator with XRE-family HTH domain
MSITGQEIRQIRHTFGWPIEHFARLLGVHTVTLSRWERTHEGVPKVEGMPLAILLGLKQRMLTAPESDRLKPEDAKQTATQIDQVLVVGGVLLALGLLLAGTPIAAATRGSVRRVIARRPFSIRDQVLCSMRARIAASCWVSPALVRAARTRCPNARRKLVFATGRASRIR